MAMMTGTAEVIKCTVFGLALLGAVYALSLIAARWGVSRQWVEGSTRDTFSVRGNPGYATFFFQYADSPSAVVLPPAERVKLRAAMRLLDADGAIKPGQVVRGSWLGVLGPSLLGVELLLWPSRATDYYATNVIMLRTIVPVTPTPWFVLDGVAAVLAATGVRRAMERVRFLLRTLRFVRRVRVYGWSGVDVCRVRRASGRGRSHRVTGVLLHHRRVFVNPVVGAE